MASNSSGVSRPGLGSPLQLALRSRRYRPWRYALIAAVFLLAHLALDQLSLRFQTQPGVTIWYPPNGLSFALLLGLGPGYAPVVLAATLISNFWTYGAPAPAVPLALWSVFIVACYTGLSILLRGRLRLDTQLRSVRAVSLFTAAAAGVSWSLATLVVLTFSPGGPLTPAQYLQTIFDWWIGEAIGLFTITPFVLVLILPWLRQIRVAESFTVAEMRGQSWSRRGLFTWAVWLAGTVVSLWLIFRTPFELQLGLQYLVFLPLMWLTLRNGLRGAVTAILVINLGGTLLSQVEPSGLSALAALQLFMLVLALTGLYLGAAVTQRGQAQTELIQAYEATIEGWSRAMDLRDHDTEGHSRRVTELTVRLARAKGFDKTALLHIRHGALLHDIGKMGVPDAILLKPGALTADEWAIMHLHPVYAYEMLEPIAYLRPALDIPYCHHEKWDGSGYPRGLAGTDIPMAARMFALVDVWDALRSDRPYRRAWPAEQVQAHIRSLAGTHFDPELVELFLKSAINDLTNFND